MSAPRPSTIALGLAAGFAGAFAFARAFRAGPRREDEEERLEPIEGYAWADFQTECNPSPKTGMVAFRDFVLREFGGASIGISRACGIGGKSEHKEGRAWDWIPPWRAGHMDPDPLFEWLLAPDAHGNPHARARRLGLQYMVWDRQAWRAYKERDWAPYRGANPHTDHVHFTLSREGARGDTSYYPELSRAARVAGVF